MSALREKLEAKSFWADGEYGRTVNCVDLDDALATFREWLEDDEALLLRVATALDPLAFDPDPHVRHRHCSPVVVDAVQGEALRRAKHLLVEIAAAPDALRAEGE